MNREQVPLDISLEFDEDSNIIYSNTYKRKKTASISFVDQATYLIENNYPVPTRDISELANLMQQNFEKKLDEEKRKEWEEWKKREHLDQI